MDDDELLYPAWMEEALFEDRPDPWDDDMYWINQREADDYRDEGLEDWDEQEDECSWCDDPEHLEGE